MKTLSSVTAQPGMGIFNIPSLDGDSESWFICLLIFPVAIILMVKMYRDLECVSALLMVR